MGSGKFSEKNIEYKIIVARYNEDISWLSHIQNKCIIYNKGYTLNLKNIQSPSSSMVSITPVEI